MRIIAGTWKSRRLAAPDTSGTRPTSDRVRETVFDILAHAVPLDGLTVIDAFAGSGALGLEALSRGAARAIFVEKSKPALQALRRNIAELDCADRTRIVPLDAVAFACRSEERADVLFADPPYAFADLEKFVRCTFERALFTQAFVLEHAATVRPIAPRAPWKERMIGDSAVTIWK